MSSQKVFVLSVERKRERERCVLNLKQYLTEQSFPTKQHCLWLWLDLTHVVVQVDESVEAICRHVLDEAMTGTSRSPHLIGRNPKG